MEVIGHQTTGVHLYAVNFATVLLVLAVLSLGENNLSIVAALDYVVWGHRYNRPFQSWCPRSPLLTEDARVYSLCPYRKNLIRPVFKRKARH
jgi:hypothetical protein